MTLFEYLAAGYALMLSFAVLRALSGVPHAARSPSRYWVHLSWLSTALASCLVGFWAFWFYREVEWTFFQFIGALAPPALLYTYVSLLVPVDPSTVTSWRDYFYGVRVPLFTTGIVMMTTIAMSNQAIAGIPLLHPSQWPTYAMIAIYAIGLACAKPSVHVALALAFPSLIAVLLFVTLGQSDPLTPVVP